MSPTSYHLVSLHPSQQNALKELSAFLSPRPPLLLSVLSSPFDRHRPHRSPRDAPDSLQGPSRCWISVQSAAQQLHFIQGTPLSCPNIPLMRPPGHHHCVPSTSGCSLLVPFALYKQREEGPRTQSLDHFSSICTHSLCNLIRAHCFKYCVALTPCLYL